MKKIIIAAMIVPLLSGCAVDMSRDSSLGAFNGLSYKNKGGNEYLKEFTKITTEKNITIEKIKLCVLRNVTNRDITLSDSSKSFVGAYTGNYYNINSSSISNGGDVVSLSGANSLAVNGTTDYIFNAGIISVRRVVRFTLDVVVDAGKIAYTFSNIQQAQTETGSLSNTGFSDIGTWKGAAPTQVIQSLDDVTHEVGTCLQS